MKNRIIVRNNRLHYEFEIKRKITIIQGDSASGKYQNTNRVYQQLYRIYGDMQTVPVKPKTIIVEDSNDSGKSGGLYRQQIVF